MRRTIKVNKLFARFILDGLEGILKGEKFQETVSVKTEENIDVYQYKKGETTLTISTTDVDKEKTEITLNGDESLIKELREKLKEKIKTLIEKDVIKKI